MESWFRLGRRWSDGCTGMAGAEVGRTCKAMAKDTEQTTYVFRGLHCATYLANCDAP